MEEHRETVADPNMVDAGGPARSVVQKSQPVISNINYRKIPGALWQRSPGSMTLSLSNKSLSPVG